MRYDVYCDESRPDLLSSENPQARFLVIGSLWLETTNRDKYKQILHDLRNKHHIGGEFKWQKVSPSRQDFYLDLIDWFFQTGLELRFRCIAVDHQEVNLLRYHKNDQELGFYKFYYQLLHHWIYDFNEYMVFCDYKSNRKDNRLNVLHQCLQWSNLSSTMLNVQAVRSAESVLIQLSDVLTGAAAARLNNTLKQNSAKQNIVNKLENLLGCRIEHTLKSEQKFNVFLIDLHGGW